MGTDLIVPEITLINKLEEVESSLPPALWQQMRNDAAVYIEEDDKLPAPTRLKKRMLLSDFVNKAISLPLEIEPEINEQTQKQLYRLHLFCCQQIVHNPEVRRNPLVLGFRALEEMHLALVGILTTFRLVHPECPYSWNDSFFSGHIVTHKGPDGHTFIKFKHPLTADIINQAITEELITDWMIYRAYDHNGIRTLTDVKNNLLDVPNFKRGGKPSAEFSRFERKMQEQRNRKKVAQDDALELELRKTLVQNVAQQAVEQLLASGVSAMDLLNQAFNGDLSKLLEQKHPQEPIKLQEAPKPEKKKKIAKQDTSEIENLISSLLEDNT